MAKGFGSPRFWAQLCWDGAEAFDRWIPLGGSEQSANQRCAALLIEYDCDFVLLIDGQCRRGAVPTVKQILADFQRRPVPGAKKIYVSR